MSECKKVEENPEKQARFFWKGKRVTEKVYKRRCLDKNLGKNLRNIYGTKRGTHKLKKEVLQNDGNCKVVGRIEGRRIIHIETLGDQMFCIKCKSILSLQDIVSEKRYGVASIFEVKCRKCRLINKVETDKKHVVRKDKKHDASKQNCDKSKECLHYDTNTKGVMGILNGGIGNTQFNKVLTNFDIPEMYWSTYKIHEKEVGAAIESMAYESCVRAAYEERMKTIENKEDVVKLLPSHLDVNFILPDKYGNNGIYPEENLVRIAASFDMGWTTRGTGRTYDSLSVISYVTLNRKCKKCDLGQSPDAHDCRLNFEGSAKAMEPHAAVKLVKENKILTECNIEVGVVIADNDSSSICAIRNACTYEVVKQADKNHTSKGVTNALYKIKKRFKELSGPAIKYLQRCFNFCISQNIGNNTNMATAIRNIPDHCFNNHENCGEWCGYKKNPDTYTHSVIKEGFKNPSLLQSLKDIFDTLANKTGSFSAGASSNANESFNSVIASKAPKSKMYGMSPSGDVRVACAINIKNDGEQYAVRLAEKLSLSPGKYTKKHTTQKDLYSRKRYINSLTRTFKKRRLFLRKRKTELRQKKELSEGTTYESDVGLLDLDATISIAEITDDEPIVILFDLETGGLSKSADILQIGAKCQNFTFSV